jgi:hypothetical protein
LRINERPDLKSGIFREGVPTFAVFIISSLGDFTYYRFFDEIF